MKKKKYELRFLPLFENDLTEIVEYISYDLMNPTAAERLVDLVQDAIRRRLEFPEYFEQYHSVKDRKNPYYRIYVENYTIYYVVIDNIMEVRRIFYYRQNVHNKL